MSLRPRLTINNGNLSVLNKDLIKGQPKTYLSASIASGVGTTTKIAVDDFGIILNEGDGRDGKSVYLWISPFTADSEILLTDPTTAPASDGIKFTGVTAKAHTESDPVYVIDWNQILFEYSATSGGTQVAIDTVDVMATSEYTIVSDNDEDHAAYYGYATFKNVINTNDFSTESVEVPYTGYALGTVGKVIIDAYEQVGLTPDFDYGINKVNDCLDDINSRKKRWTPQRVLNETLGQTSDLAYAFTLPTLIREPDNLNPIMEIRLDGEPLEELDYQTFKEEMDDAKLTTLNGALAAGGITATLTSSYDFGETGSLDIVGQDDAITFTSNAETTGIVSGVPASGDGAITATLADGANVWQDASEGSPKYFTIDSDSQLLIYPLPDANNINKNIFIDYYKKVTSVDDIADTLDTHRYNLVKMWLEWKVRGLKENNGVTSLEDPAYIRYEVALAREVKFDKGDKFFAFRNVRDAATVKSIGFDIHKYNQDN